MNFIQKTVWITGASSGIGEALVWEFAGLGADVVLSSRNIEKLDQLAKELAKQFKVKTDVIPLDLGDNNSVLKAVDEFKKRHHKIDILVNNAGISQRSL